MIVGAGTFATVSESSRNSLTALVRWIHARGWSPGTGGNFSMLLQRGPLQMLITPSGIDKGELEPRQLLVCDEDASVLDGSGKPSAETLLHTAIYQRTNAEAVLHTHTVWNTLASLSPSDAFDISGLEMVKALSGVTTHEHTEFLPILENSQDMAALSCKVHEAFDNHPQCHGFLLRGHGLYTWGADAFEARRHLEALEFLFEVSIRSNSITR